jgi:hypothetical protein
LEAFGIGGWPLVRQKAWAQLIPDKSGKLSPSECHALLRVLEIEPAGQLEWLQRERSKFAVAAFTRDERAVLRRFAFESSQTVDDMLRALDGHEDFRGVGDSSMQHEARFYLVKKSEDKLPAIIPLKGDREFLMTELKKNPKKPARKLAAPPFAGDSATPAPVCASSAPSLAHSAALELSYAHSAPSSVLHTCSMAKVTLGGNGFVVNHPDSKIIDCSKCKRISADECGVLGMWMKKSDFTVETLNLVRFFFVWFCICYVFACV